MGDLVQILSHLLGFLFSMKFTVRISLYLWFHLISIVYDSINWFYDSFVMCKYLIAYFPDSNISDIDAEVNSMSTKPTVLRQWVCNKHWTESAHLWPAH